jgi:hypothetical protein
MSVMSNNLFPLLSDTIAHEIQCAASDEDHAFIRDLVDELKQVCYLAENGHASDVKVLLDKVLTKASHNQNAAEHLRTLEL